MGIRLLEAVSEVGSFLSRDERAEADRVVLPTETIRRGDIDMAALLEHSDAFGAVLLNGMLLQRLRVGEQVGLRLLGPGDIVSLTVQPSSMLLSYSGCRALAKTDVALLGREMLVGARRWPQLLAALHVQVAEQADRLAVQLVICQLPRVEQRLIAIMWLLAESWGNVTPAGTTLPLSLTHDALGGLIGARRSTVTLALGELAERGSLIRQDGGWLLLEPPPTSAARLPAIKEPHVLEQEASVWQEHVAVGDGASESGARRTSKTR